jgi:pimeloyl-ACP methyl ester carboxylesterase
MEFLLSVAMTKLNRTRILASLFLAGLDISTAANVFGLRRTFPKRRTFASESSGSYKSIKRTERREERITKTRSGNYVNALSQTSSRIVISPAAGSVVPTLLIHGDNDASTPIDTTGSRTGPLIKGSQLKVYEGAAHGLPITHASQLNSDFAGFSGIHS